MFACIVQEKPHLAFVVLLAEEHLIGQNMIPVHGETSRGGIGSAEDSASARTI